MVKRLLVALLAAALRRFARGAVPVAQVRPEEIPAQAVLTTCYLGGEVEMTPVFLRMGFSSAESAACLLALKHGVSVAEGAHV
jgi:hypothetical protein